MKVGFMC